MDRPASLSHTTWVCKYHVVFIPKCRRRTLYAQLRRHLGEVFHNLARQKESTIEEGHLLSPMGKGKTPAFRRKLEHPFLLRVAS